MTLQPSPARPSSSSLLATCALLCLVGLSSCKAGRVADNQATPQRPTFSSDTSTTAPGSYELEAGIISDPSDSLGLPATLKYGAGESTEVFLGWSPLTYIDFPGGSETGIGDLGLGLRHRFQEESDNAPSAAIQATLKLPTADEDRGLGTGEMDASFAGIVTKNMEPYTVTGFFALDVLGDPTGGTDLGQSLALATSRPMNETWGAVAELAGVFIPDQNTDSVFLTLAATHSNIKPSVLDFGIILGLTDDAPDFQIFVGTTRNLGGN